MKCKNCPAEIVEEGNESDPTTYYYCFSDCETGCYKRLKTIQRDLEEFEKSRRKGNEIII